MSLESRVLRLMEEPHPGPAGRVALGGLALLEKAYIRGVTARRAKETARAVHVGIPVISVGNITAGGTGKTPCIMKLAALLARAGRSPAVLTRGYRGGLEKTGGIVSDRTGLRVTQAMAGDEPYMMAVKLPGVPVIAGRDRTVSAAAARALGADVLLLDDGFQYWKLARDLDIVLIDSTHPFGGGRVLPRGLLREPMDALRRAGLFILTKAGQVPKEDRAAIREALHAQQPEAPVLEADHTPQTFTPLAEWPAVRPIAEAAGAAVFLLSGIGNPGGFRKTAEEAGFLVKGALALPDHHDYTEADLARASEEAAACGADVIAVTEKDAVKIKDRLAWEAAPHCPIGVLGIEMTFSGSGEAVFQKKAEEFL